MHGGGTGAHGWDPAATIFQRSVSPVSGPIFTCHTAPGIVIPLLITNVLLYTCFTLVIYTLDFAKFPLLR